jgi:hypothetical protein
MVDEGAVMDAVGNRSVETTSTITIGAAAPPVSSEVVAVTATDDGPVKDGEAIVVTLSLTDTADTLPALAGTDFDVTEAQLMRL